MDNCLLEEETHTFDCFTYDMAYKLGTFFYEYAKEKQIDLCADIYANGHTLFHFSTDGSTADKDNWLRRKRNAVLQFAHSSKFMNLKCKGDDSLIETKYGCSLKDMTFTPGAFPILVKNVGCIGSIAVSGLAPDEDHQLIISGLDALMGKE